MIFSKKLLTNKNFYDTTKKEIREMIGMEELLEVKNELLEKKAKLIEEERFVDAELSVVDKFIAKEEAKSCESVEEVEETNENLEYQGDEI